METSMTGRLLVASSFVTEPIYAGGVCLIVHQDEENVIGVMLNRPIKPDPEALMALLAHAKLEQIDLADDSLDSDSWDDSIAEHSTSGDLIPVPGGRLGSSINHEDQIIPSLLKTLHFGGPQSGPVVAIHQDQQCAEAETGSGIFVAAQREHLEQLVQSHSTPFRLIVGHMRWDPEQLENERACGVWHSLPATRQIVFAPPMDMWNRLIRRATSRSMAGWIGADDIVNAGELN